MRASQDSTDPVSVVRSTLWCILLPAGCRYRDRPRSL